MKVRRRKKILSRQANEFLPKLRRRMIDAMSSKGRALVLKAWESVFHLVRVG